MAWIESHQELARHPKTLRLARELGVSTVTAIGHLHSIWWWALDFAPEGDLSDHDPTDIAIGAGWEGKPAQLIEALVRARFLDRDEDGRRLHDWDDYAGKWIDRRRANAARKRASRRAAHPGTNPSAGHHADGREASGATRPNQYLTRPDQEPPSSEVTPLDVVRPEIERLCTLLADLVAASGVKRPSVTKAWHDACRRLLNRDGYSEAQVEQVIRWVQTDEFWRPNVQSMPKLREKFSQLLLKSGSPNSRARPIPGMRSHELAQQLKGVAP